ncbi:MAG: NERD domain-containing protein [Bacilli bacterium]|nr:NERD domain-containing protein [Bacilli bacterium]
MLKIITNFIDNHYYLVFIFFLIIFFIILFIIKKIYRYHHGLFGEGNIYKRLRKLYSNYDYPYLKHIILNYNKKSYAFYDAIVFGDYYIYILEIKNHHHTLKIDPIDYWSFMEHHHEITIMNPFYELEIKKHILRRYLEVEQARIIEITIINDKTKTVGNHGPNHLIKSTQLQSLIKHYENNPALSKMNAHYIEKIGNNLLDVNQKKKKHQVINNIKNQRTKR